MPLTAFALVLVAAVLHALWNIVAKRADAGRHFVLLGALAIVLLWAPLGLWLAWPAVPGWGLREWALVGASGAVHLLYFNVLLAGYRASDLTVVYPVARGTGPLVTALGATVLLGEVLTLRSGLGVLAVAGGVWLIAGGPRLFGPTVAGAGTGAGAGAGAGGAVDQRRVRAGIAWGAATGLLIAGYTLIDGYVVKVAMMSPVLVDYLGNALRIPFMLPSAWRDRPGLVAEWRRNWRAVLVLAAVSPLGYVLVLYAATMAPLSHVAPAREMSMLFAALLGGRLLGEADRGLRLAGAACMAVGVVLLTV